jgi:hypothetical protein
MIKSYAYLTVEQNQRMSLLKARTFIFDCYFKLICARPLLFSPPHPGFSASANIALSGLKIPVIIK